MKIQTIILSFLLAIVLATPVLAKEKLAVMELEAFGGVDDYLAEILTSTLKDELDAVGDYSIISREEIEALATRLALQQQTGDCTDSDCLADMGKALGTKLMVYGSIAKIGKTYSLSLRLLDTENKEAVRRVNERCKCSEEDLFNTVQIAAAKLMGKEGGMIKRNILDQPKIKDKVWVEPLMGLEFIRVDGDCYSMGGAGVDDYPSGESVDGSYVHQVCLDDFYIAKYEMNQKSWVEIMGGNPSGFKHKKLFGKTDISQYPVENVSWNDAQVFIEKLNSKTGKTFRLPTEAEWEYAARSEGESELYAGGDSYGIVGWGGADDIHYESGWRDADYYSGGYTHKIDTKDPNGLGLFLMSGNVAEWCSDWFDQDYYKSSPPNNPKGPEKGVEKVVRGGSWQSLYFRMMTHARSKSKPDTKSNKIGFRLVLQSL